MHEFFYDDGLLVFSSNSELGNMARTLFNLINMVNHTTDVQIQELISELERTFKSRGSVVLWQRLARWKKQA